MNKEMESNGTDSCNEELDRKEPFDPESEPDLESEMTDTQDQMEGEKIEKYCFDEETKDFLHMYLKEIGQFPLLTVKEEKELWNHVVELD